VDQVLDPVTQDSLMTSGRVSSQSFSHAPENAIIMLDKVTREEVLGRVNDDSSIPN